MRLAAVITIIIIAAVGCGASSDDMRDLGAASDDFATVAPSGDGGVTCGASDCLLGNDNVCCVETAESYCAPSNACSSGIPIYCDGPEDCGGGACCQPMDTMSLVCRAQCDGAVICHGDGDCPAAAPRCCPDRVLGYSACETAC